MQNEVTNMRTEAILSRMENAQRKRRWKKIFWYIKRELLRGTVCLIGGAVIVLIAVTVMDMLMENWRSRLFIELAVSYAGILYLVAKVYRLQ